MDASYPSTTEQNTTDLNMAWSRIHDYIQVNMDDLLRSCRAYAHSLGLTVNGQGSGDIAVEILSETLLQARTSAASYDPSRPLRPWIMKIAIRVAQDRMGKDQRRRKREISIEPEVNRLFDLASEPEMQIEDSDIVRSMLAPLKREDREIVRRVAIEGWDMQAVSEQMGMQPDTVRQRYHRALKRLRTILPAPSCPAQSDEEGTK